MYRITTHHLPLNVLCTGCQINGFLGSVGALSEIWSLCAVSLDRFKGVHHPLNSEKRITKFQVYILRVWLTLTNIWVIQNLL